MVKKLLVVLCLFAITTAHAQKPKPKTNPKTKAKTTAVDSTGADSDTPVDPMEALEATLPLEVELDPMSGKKIVHKDIIRRNDSLRKDLAARLKKERMSFWARTKYPNPKAKVPQKTQLCINLVSKDTNYVHCINDSICLDPEVAKVLFEKRTADSTYMLVFLDAFNKNKNDGGMCSTGHESKLLFIRWNTKTNGIKIKTKNIASCARGITNMTKEPIADWDKSAPLIVKYNRSVNFYEIMFDPAKPELGIQAVKDDGSSAKATE